MALQSHIIFLSRLTNRKIKSKTYNLTIKTKGCKLKIKKLMPKNSKLELIAKDKKNKTKN